MPAGLDFDSLVSLYYGPLYQFAYSLAGTPADASDLTQQTFYIWATKGQQLRDAARVKTWLFTTLYREFLRGRRRESPMRRERALLQRRPDWRRCATARPAPPLAAVR